MSFAEPQIRRWSVVEVSDATLAYDRGRKASLYDASGITGS